MEFKKYNSITNHYHNDFIEKIKNLGLDKLEYCVTEKIHGANVGIYVTKDKISLASRNGFCGDNFFNIRALKNRYEKHINQIFNYMYSYYGIKGIKIEEIIIFCEVFGGNYLNKEKIINAKQVQKGVYYTNENDLLVFDIYDNTNKKYIPYNEVPEILSRARQSDNIVLGEIHPFLDTVPFLFRGSFEECLNYPNDLESVVYERYNLPKIEGNIMEGIVIKPYKEQIMLSTDSERLIIKSKNSKFTEKQKVLSRAINPLKLNKESEIYLNELLELINENRLNNILSKDTYTIQDFNKIKSLFFEDIFKEYNNESFKNNDVEQNKIINSNINVVISELIKKVMLKK
jgi:Rnl2 family RNA ligase